ncbi:hypothetical protein B0E47_11630 [Rhodanobacter sp. B05]|uniref:J domain-containing protein n=1 Tax=Rhodanobacter sp. B05 TaxID=1945859 RepID=UPI0009874BB0|nr:J domain-containing protein [Rhodanobacter sp. B05]OOG53849.1 hypothetical protein B0E47_11630 [Rhodanobacter sp. B05]
MRIPATTGELSIVHQHQRVPDVARETDFLDLYKILGLQPGCGLDEFKYAYRRRVSVLHPDRRDDDSHHAVAAERLQRLTAMYGMAMEFHREHGRLPGAPLARPNTQMPATAANQPVRRARSRQPPRRSMRWLLLPAAAAVIWLSWPGEHPSTPSLSILGGVRPPPPLASPAQVGASPIGLGMDADAVRASEGEPTLMVNNERWEYGPSWIRFERGKVVDWYSSPLYPLNTTTRSPGERTIDHVPR